MSSKCARTSWVLSHVSATVFVFSHSHSVMRTCAFGLLHYRVVACSSEGAVDCSRVRRSRERLNTDLEVFRFRSARPSGRASKLALPRAQVDHHVCRTAPVFAAHDRCESSGLSRSFAKKRHSGEHVSCTDCCPPSTLDCGRSAARSRDVPGELRHTFFVRHDSWQP